MYLIFYICLILYIYLIHTLYISDPFQLRIDKVTDRSYNISDIFRKQYFNAFKALRRNEKKRPDGKLSHFTQ